MKQISLKKYVGKTLKMTRKSMAEDSGDIDEIVRRITSEVSSIPKPRDYDLSEFCFDKTIKGTSETLLTLISKLISRGDKTKKAITLSQCIQQHIGSWKGRKKSDFIRISCETKS